jgi:PAS domain S-box-containing protein
MKNRICNRLIETMNDGLWVLDEHAFITFANEKLCQMLGCTRNDIIGHHATDFIDENDRQTFQERFEEHREGIFAALELTCRRTDGRKIFTIVSPGPILGEQGKFNGCFAVITDITERKQTEDALKESEQRFRAIFDHAFDGILLAEPEEKKLVTGNRAICEMLGCSLKELEAMKVYDIHPQEHLAEALDQFERMDRGEVTIAQNVPLKNKNGGVFYADISCSHLSISGQKYLVGIFRDTTKRKHSEEQRKQWNEQLESIVLERTRQLEAVVAELESEIVDRRQSENFLKQKQSVTQEFYDGIVESLTNLQMSLRNIIYEPAEDVMFKLGDMHVLIEEILKKIRKVHVTLL